MASVASDATGAPATKRMRRRVAFGPRISTVAVPSKPRRMTKASHCCGLESNGGVHATEADAWKWVPGISASLDAGQRRERLAGDADRQRVVARFVATRRIAHEVHAHDVRAVGRQNDLGLGPAGTADEHRDVGARRVDVEVVRRVRRLQLDRQRLAGARVDPVVDGGVALDRPAQLRRRRTLGEPDGLGADPGFASRARRQRARERPAARSFPA